MEKTTPSAVEIALFYKSLGLEKNTFLKLDTIYRVAIQCSLGSYLLVAMVSTVGKLISFQETAPIYYLFVALQIIFLLFIAMPKIAPSGLFYLRLFPIALLAVHIRWLIISDINLLWYGRLFCVLLNMICFPAFFRFHRNLSTARKKAIDEYLQKDTLKN